MSRRNKLALAVVAGALALGLSGYLLALFCLPCRIVAVVAAGNCGPCSLRQSLTSYRMEQRRSRTLPPEKVRRLRGEADGCQLWAVGDRQVWAPGAGARWVNSVSFSRYRYLDATGETLVHPGDVVLDCGAYNGDTTREALAAGASRVVAIEPSPRNLSCLRRNLEQEIADERVTLVEKGVWDHEDSLLLEEEPFNPAADHIADIHRTSARSPLVQVPLTTIDQLVKELGLERVDYIKMDIEGAERHALVGARETIRKFRPRLAIAAYHLPDDRETLPDLVKSIWPGYELDYSRCLLEGWRIQPRLFYFRAPVSPPAGGNPPPPSP